MSFEYYLNNEIVLNQLRAKERQRIIYIFKEVKDIEGLELGNIIIEENNRTLEVDGVILEKENKNITLDKNIFISDSINKFLISTKNKKKTLINYIKKNENAQEDNDEKDDIFFLDKNSLCVIEIKNQFPPYRPEEKNKEIYNKINAKNKYQIDFFNMVKSLLKKSLVFKEMFEQLNEKVESIKIVLLYDAIYKFNYEEEVVKAINDIIGVENEKLIEMLEFQCIYIKSSYLAGGFYNFKSEQKKMEIKMQEMNEQLEKRGKEILEMKEKMEKKDKDILELKEKMEKKDKEIMEMKDKFDGSIKDLIKEVKKLKDKLKDKKEDDDNEKERVKTNVDELSEKKEKEDHISVNTQSKNKFEEGNGKEKKDN